MDLSRPLVCVVTRARGGSGSAERASLIDRLASAAAAGASMIQIRERQLDDRAVREFARELIRATSGSACLVTINDRTDIAIAAGAAGVHLKSGAVSGADVRKVAPPGFIVGRSVHSVEEAAAVEREGACDYLFFGTVFASSSKPADHPIAGVDLLREICARVALPVVAIGGVTPFRAPAVADAGAAGAAAISFFAEARDTAEAVASLRGALTGYPGRV